MNENESFDEWETRIKKKNNNAIWIEAENTLLNSIVDIHDEKVTIIRKNITDRCAREDESKKRKNDLLVEEFYNKNKDFIHAVLVEIKKKEKETDLYGLSDKTIFKAELKKFTKKLANHHSYQSLEEMCKYGFDFVGDFERKITEQKEAMK